MTIYALSSGPGLAGISVIRVSGPDTKKVILKLTNKELPEPRVASRRKINKIEDNKLIDEGLVNGRFDSVKILADGEITKKLNIKAHAFSALAKVKIEEAGGSCEVI